MLFHRDKEKPEAKFEVKYISGHSMYPHEKGTHVKFYADRLELEHMNMLVNDVLNYTFRVVSFCY